MKELNLQVKVNVYDLDEVSEADRKLLESAREAPFRSYNIISGNNQENAAYPSGLCAERTTLFYANAQHPNQAVDTLAIAARNERGEFLAYPISPCGACRQVMLETEKRFNQPMRVLLYGTAKIYEVKSITDLLPLQFDASAME